MYTANLNPANPVGTIQSIEHTLRNLDKLAADQQTRLDRIKKEPEDYKEQSDRPFEHQGKLRELLLRQAELTGMLDLDKGDQQAVAAEPEIVDGLERRDISEAASSYMRKSGGAIENLAITERRLPQTGSVTGRAIAKADSHVAIATAANSFVLVPLNGAASSIAVGDKLAVKVQNGLARVCSGLDRER